MVHHTPSLDTHPALVCPDGHGVRAELVMGVAHRCGDVGIDHRCGRAVHRTAVGSPMISLAVIYGFILVFGCVLAVIVWHIHR